MSLTRILALSLLASTAAAQTPIPGNRAPLQETPFTALPLGSVRATGWLRQQLEMQKEGLTGRAEFVFPELDETSAWRGGGGDNWERSPYYVKGLLPLAYTLDDEGLKEQVQKWVDWTLMSQRDDGFYGPNQNDDWWPRMVSNYFLRDYYDATGDDRVLPFLTRYYKHMLRNLPQRPLRDWGRARAGDDMDTAIWLYNHTGDAFLLDLVDLLRAQAYDWPTILHKNTFQSFGLDFQPRHNVNIPQAMKMPAVSWQRTNDPAERSAIDAGTENLMRENGLSVGMQSGTEFLGGRSPAQGIEFCSIVEQMLSDETIVRIFGEGKHADRLEQITYNALPAAWNRDLTAIRYYTLPNHVIAKNGSQGFGQNYHNGIVYGPRSGYPCCCFNVHQGWPKFVQNSWVATSAGGLAPVVYAPNVVSTTIHDTDVTITQNTNYPFGEEIRFAFDTERPVSFPFSLRTPVWCTDPTIRVNGRPVDAAEAGGFNEITRAWSKGDVVTVSLPMEVRVQRGVHNSASVHYGPLVFALEIPGAEHVTGQPVPGFNETELRPEAAWNYALDLGKDIRVIENEDAGDGTNPFDARTTPIKLLASAKKLPGWGLAWNGVASFDPPQSPVASSEREEKITLVPFGSEGLRLTDFPVLGSPLPELSHVVSYSFNDDKADGWYWLGGSWWVDNGRLETSSTGGAPGFKALIEGVTTSDVRVDAEISPPPSGDAGIVVRVSQPSIGPDAYEGYYAGVNAQTNTVVLGKANGTSWNPLQTVDLDIPSDTPTTLSVQARGSSIEVFVNNGAEPVISVRDSSYTSGSVGVRMYTGHNDDAFAGFDNVRVTPLLN